MNFYSLAENLSYVTIEVVYVRMLWSRDCTSIVQRMNLDPLKESNIFLGNISVYTPPPPHPNDCISAQSLPQ